MQNMGRLRMNEYVRLARMFVPSRLPKSDSQPRFDATRSVAEPLYVDKVEVAAGELTVSGWSLPSEESAAIDPREFRVNGRPFDQVSYPLPRLDVGKAFCQRRNAEMSGFECRTAIGDNPYLEGILEIERVRPAAKPIERGRDCWFVPDPALHGDLPDEDRRFRVVGNRDREGFLNTGATVYHRLDRAVSAISGQRLHEFARVLDWGCGCGRAARHFPARAAAALNGGDIDHDNVAWCSAHVGGRYFPSSIAPPLPFDPPGSGFDLVYGISAFTHLREPLQMQWLAELARVTAKGAYLLMTIHGPTAIEFAHRSPAESTILQDQVERQDLLVASSNNQIDGHADHHREYVNVFHSHDYIRRTWSRFFDVLAIVPGYIFTHDLVVLQKR